jgi:uracil-DNA glycosylase family 4
LESKAVPCVNVGLVSTDRRRSPNNWLCQLDAEIISCTRCPRLVEYRERIAREKRRAYLDWDYWGKPVPGFGDPEARVLVLGLAPGAHGSNRKPTATRRDDGLKLKDLYITAAARCAPPDNKPLPQELANCSSYLDREMEGLKNLRVVVALGKIAFDAYLNYLKRRGQLASRKEYVFRHGAQYEMPDGKTLLASYHPSNQNTQTGKLTRGMFMEIFREAARLADGKG